VSSKEKRNSTLKEALANPDVESSMAKLCLLEARDA
jgi:hypothetical protein